MLRGTKKFKCGQCGHVFEGPDVELNATVASAPVPCPKCGSMTKASAPGILGWIQSLF